MGEARAVRNVLDIYREDNIVGKNKVTLSRLAPVFLTAKILRYAVKFSPCAPQTTLSLISFALSLVWRL